MLNLTFRLTSSNDIWEFCNDIKEHGIEATIHVSSRIVKALDMLDLYNYVEHHVAVLHIQSHSSADINVFLDKWRYNLHEATGS